MHGAEVGSVADLSKIHAASIIRIEWSEMKIVYTSETLVSLLASRRIPPRSC
jgi:hypothetical protein